MRNLILGIILGSTLTAGLGVAGSNLYNNQGQVQALRGSQQQMDYFKQRQMWLDLSASRRAAEELARNVRPCGR